MQEIALHLKLTMTFALNTLITFALVIVPIEISDEKTSYTIVLVLSAMFGISYAFLQSGLYGVAGPCPAQTNSLTVGLGISALLLNLMRVIVLASTDDLELGAQIYFYLTGTFMAVCTFLSYRYVNLSTND